MVTSASITTTSTYIYDGTTLCSLSATSTKVVTTTPTWSITYVYDSDGNPYAGIYKANNTTSAVLFGTVELELPRFANTLNRDDRPRAERGTVQECREAPACHSRALRARNALKRPESD